MTVLIVALFTNMTKKELKKRRKKLWKVLTQALAYNLCIKFKREAGKGLVLEEEEEYITLNAHYILPYGVTFENISEAEQQHLKDAVAEVLVQPSGFLMALDKEKL